MKNLLSTLVLISVLSISQFAWTSPSNQKIIIVSGNLTSLYEDWDGLLVMTDRFIIDGNKIRYDLISGNETYLNCDGGEYVLTLVGINEDESKVYDLSQVNECWNFFE